MKNYDNEINSLKNKVELLLIELEQAKKNTTSFLNECKKSEIDFVSIGVRSKKIGNENWPFGSNGSVFTMDNVRDKNGHPAIWGVVEKLKINGGCGNSGQHSVDSTPLIEGLYRFKNGKWNKEE